MLSLKTWQEQHHKYLQPPLVSVHVKVPCHWLPQKTMSTLSVFIKSAVMVPRWSLQVWRALNLVRGDRLCPKSCMKASQPSCCNQSHEPETPQPFRESYAAGIEGADNPQGIQDRDACLETISETSFSRKHWMRSRRSCLEPGRNFSQRNFSHC